MNNKDEKKKIEVEVEKQFARLSIKITINEGKQEAETTKETGVKTTETVAESGSQKNPQVHYFL